MGENGAVRFIWGYWVEAVDIVEACDEIGVRVRMESSLLF